MIFLFGLTPPKKGMEHKAQYRRAWNQRGRVHSSAGIHPTLMASDPQCWILDIRSALATAKSILPPELFINTTSPLITTMETSRPSILKHYQTLTSLLADFLAKPSQWPVCEKDSLTHEVRSSLKSFGLLGKSNHAFCCLKTLQAFYLTTRARPLLPSLTRFHKWGMTVNGKCVTANISAFPKTVNGSSLFAILEAQPDLKYFLSDKQKQFILHPKRLKKYTRVLSRSDNMPTGMEPISRKP